MDVTLRVPRQLRELVGGAAVLDVRVGESSDETVTIATVLDALAARHPALERRIRDELGHLRRHVNVFVGSDNIRDRDGAATTIRPGDEVSVLPAVSGGR